MYLYIENNIFINLKEIELLMDYKDFISNGNNKKIMEKEKRRILDLTENEKKRRTLIFTEKFVYISSYTNRALKMRADEYDKLVNSIVF
ncbi:DUF370 domain-containing protein [Pseudoleptotrichia goodfellowii]|uniref:Uncharacterized protein n=1 Tax=Pseudoleptotrichia goodfellowii TaxID=157692 RepID=A0A510J755_9FUSO|nr:DUF370 domain-containing protein [Pseudoleptotrichia goodfellowii]BBM35100.1 hypothetical protein JCM16774_0005 [Pseudoleptotrichia goodfellowii]